MVEAVYDEIVTTDLPVNIDTGTATAVKRRIMVMLRTDTASAAETISMGAGKAQLTSINDVETVLGVTLGGENTGTAGTLTWASVGGSAVITLGSLDQVLELCFIGVER